MLRSRTTVLESCRISHQEHIPSFHNRFTSWQEGAVAKKMLEEKVEEKSRAEREKMRKEKDELIEQKRLRVEKIRNLETKMDKVKKVQTFYTNL